MFEYPPEGPDDFGLIRVIGTGYIRVLLSL